MANHPSSEKRNRQRINRTLRNRAIKSAVRTHVKNVREAVVAKDAKTAQTALTAATAALDKAVGKGALPKKTASRTVSRLASAVHQIQKA